MKNLTILSILELVLYIVIAIVANAGCIGSVIQAGEFQAWQVGYIALALVSLLLVCVKAREMRKEANK